MSFRHMLLFRVRQQVQQRPAEPNEALLFCPMVRDGPVVLVPSSYLSCNAAYSKCHTQISLAILADDDRRTSQWPYC